MKKIVVLLLLSIYASAQTPIHKIQGSGSTSPMIGEKVVVRGIVNGNYSGKDRLNGFFLQELHPDEDETTSEGLFIYDPSGKFQGKVGDYVEVSGTVAELKSAKSSLTQLKDLSSVLVLDEKVKMPAPLLLTLPVENSERFEGMYVKIQGPLLVTELYNLGRFGQITLSVDGPSNAEGTDARFDQFTQFNAPDKAAYEAYLSEIEKRKLILDDGSGGRNPGFLPFGREGHGFDYFHAVRGGDYTKSLTGIWDDRFDAYRIQPTEKVYFKPKNKRNSKPAKIPKKTDLVVAGFNVLNYFNGDGKGGGFPTERGAHTAEELERQQAKTINVILASGADVVSLMEIENDGFGEYSAIQTLAAALTAASNGKRNFVACENPDRGTDVIASAILYDSKKVRPVGELVTMPDGYGYASFDSARRKPLIQTFQVLKNDEVFTLVGLHLKSKGVQSVGEGNEDKGDGQGRNNLLRIQQAEDLTNWLNTRPTGTEDLDYLLIGDFNAYAMEDPMTYFKNHGYLSLFAPTSYSYVYDGFWGALDHALASPSLMHQVTRSYKWHINADEAPVLDYNTEFKTAEQVQNYFAPTPFRSSDHDPILIGLRLRTPR
jgi:predicted extracellular nuclease